jgi:hypothetical protein
VQLDYAILADAVTARADGKFDVSGAGWDTIHAGAVPATHPRLSLVVRLLISRTEAEHPHTLTVIVQGPDGEEISRAVGTGGALSEEERSRISPTRRASVSLILNFDGLVFPTYGDYQIVIQWDGNEARPPLQLAVAPPPQP